MLAYVCSNFHKFLFSERPSIPTPSPTYHAGLSLDDIPLPRCPRCGADLFLDMAATLQKRRAA